MTPKVVVAARFTRSMMGRRLAWSTALLGLASVAACPKPTVGNPQIAISPNLAARSPAARARAHPLAAGEQLGGPNATGKVGDWILANDEVVFVIDALGSGGGFAESGGNLVDAADARTRKDELGQLFTHFGTLPRQAVYGSIDAAEDARGAAVITARGRELIDPALAVETTYRLGPADRRCSSPPPSRTAARRRSRSRRSGTPSSGAARRRSRRIAASASRGLRAGCSSAASGAS